MWDLFEIEMKKCNKWKWETFCFKIALRTGARMGQVAELEGAKGNVQRIVQPNWNHEAYMMHKVHGSTQISVV